MMAVTTYGTHMARHGRAGLGFEGALFALQRGLLEAGCVQSHAGCGWVQLLCRLGQLTGFLMREGSMAAATLLVASVPVA